MHRSIQLGLALLTLCLVPKAYPQTPVPTAKAPAKIIIDTDIGDDLDDAFAVALALRSPEVKVLGFTTAFGDTELRAKLLDRLLADTGNAGIPVAAGRFTPRTEGFSQRRYALARPDTAKHRDAVTFLLEQINRYPGEITLVAIGPLVNIGDLIDRDPAAFRKFKQVFLMGGSVDRGYDDLGYVPAHGPDAEWNIANDPVAAGKLFASGVPIFMLPLDSTQLKLDEVKRALLFAQGTPYTDALAILYHQYGQQTPTLFDPMTIASLIQPSLCPMQPIRIKVDEKGFTRREPGTPNAQVCLRSGPEAFFQFLIPRLLSNAVEPAKP